MVQTQVGGWPSAAVRRVSQIPMWLLRRGVPMGPLRLLRTRHGAVGIPIVVLRHAGQRWLVSVFGEVGWVRQVRATGTAQLVRGRRVEVVRVTEVLDRRRAEAAWQLRRSYRLIPFVRTAFVARPRDGMAAFLAEAPRHPVFVIDAPGGEGADGSRS